MNNNESLLPLYVDLDGTLIKSDLTLESLLTLVKRNVLYVLLLPIWLLRGRAFLKHQLSRRVTLSFDSLPFNREFLAFLEGEKRRGRSLTLISASNAALVEQLRASTDLFDAAYGSDEKTNLRGSNKLRRIRELNAGGQFAYAGNSRADLPLWAAASEVISVNCDRSLARGVGQGEQRNFDTPVAPLVALWRAMRPHQWLKNGLLFLPLLLSHQLDRSDLVWHSLIGFVSFCLCASSVYLLNDLLDLNSDRQHHSKKHRPFASGALDLYYGFVAIPLLLLAAFLIALFLPRPFLLVLIAYWALTCAYSLLLKQLLIVDVLTLAALYTLRVVAGSEAIGVVTTNFLIAFSLALFLSLALVKRVAELSKPSVAGQSNIAGRAYSDSQIVPLTVVGLIAAALAVGVLAFYVTAPDTTGLYSSPMVLWAICPLLLFMLARIWWLTRMGKMDEDPVLFAAGDRLSQLLVLACAGLAWVAI